MWEEDIPIVGTVSAISIRDAVDRARDAFWSSIAASFPEVTTGDLGPDDVIPFDMATNRVVVSWLEYNHPSIPNDPD